jgi:hypothetical protein
MSRTIRQEIVIADLPGGIRAMYVLPVIPDNAPDTIREGIARRRLAALTGKCPCGADSPELSRQQRRARARAQAKRAASATLTRATFEHEPDCPAIDTNLVPLIQAWATGTDTQDRT